MAKERIISLKGLIHRANIAATAAGFFNAYLDNLRAGKISDELDEIVSPFIRKVQEGSMRAGAALNDLRDSLFKAHLASEQKKAEASIAKAMETKEPKAYVATIRNEDGSIMTRQKENGEVEELYKEFEKQTDAERWCIRRLFQDSCVDWHGEILFTRAPKGIDDTLVIDRNDAIAEVLRPGKTPMMHRTKTSATLSNKMKATGDHFHFSRG